MWNIETWVVHLGGVTVVEDQNIYKNHPNMRRVDYPTMADAFVGRYRNWKHSNPAETTPPSMITTFEEMKRFGL
jgi:hypothetical protein